MWGRSLLNQLQLFEAFIKKISAMRKGEKERVRERVRARVCERVRKGEGRAVSDSKSIVTQKKLHDEGSIEIPQQPLLR